MGWWWSSEQSTGILAAPDAVRILMKTSTQLSRCCWVRKTNLRAKRNFTWGRSIDHQFRRLFTKFCVSSGTRKGALNSWLKRTARTCFFSACSLRDDNVITSKRTWKLKHANSILEPSEYYCQISSKSIHIISSYTVSKLGLFLLRHSVQTLDTGETVYRQITYTGQTVSVDIGHRWDN